MENIQGKVVIVTGGSSGIGEAIGKRLTREGAIESAGKFRSTAIYPGFIESELIYGSSDEQSRNAIMAGYEQFAISADRIGDAVVYAMAQPEDASVNEITVRASAQEF